MHLPHVHRLLSSLRSYRPSSLLYSSLCNSGGLDFVSKLLLSSEHSHPLMCFEVMNAFASCPSIAEQFEKLLALLYSS